MRFPHVAEVTPGFRAGSARDARHLARYAGSFGATAGMRLVSYRPGLTPPRSSRPSAAQRREEDIRIEQNCRPSVQRDTFDRDAMQQATLALIIIDREMPRRA